MNWWIVPGLAILGLGLAMMVARIFLALVGRGRQASLGLRAIFLQRIGIGLLFLGVRISMFVPALARGPDVGGLIVGALVAGMGGLYFISVTDPVFKKGGSLMDLRASNRPASQKDAKGEDGGKSQPGRG